MKKKFINTVYVEGYLYEHDLTIKKVMKEDSKNYGKNFITGSISIATDDKLMNIVQVVFRYVAPEYKTFTILSDIISGKLGTVLDYGKESATKMAVVTNIAVNDWYREDGTLVSGKRNEGGFINIIKGDFTKSEDERNTFKADMLITKVTELEANEEKGYEEKVTVDGYIFNYRNDILPVSFRVRDPKAIKYFNGLDISPKNPIFTQVWGNIESQVVVKKTVTESAFGDDLVEERESSYKEYVLKSKSKEDYLFNDETTITVDELKAALSAREQMLAEIKQRNEEYKKTKNTKPSLDSTFNLDDDSPSDEEYTF